jgi:hypothetical protein
MAVGFMMILSSCKPNSNLPGDSAEWLIPSNEVQDGGPGQDGIPALSDPPFIPVGQVGFLSPGDLIIGVRFGDTIWGFPHRILDRHEIVNILGGANPFVLSYCPLTGTGMAWPTRAGDSNPSYGVSGLLYNSNLILYDRQTESYWAQMMMKCVSGPRIRENAQMLHVIETTWSTWQQLYPNSQVLSNQTGFSGGYDVYPYGDYKTSTGLLFPVSGQDGRLHPKERVHGVIVGDQTKTYIIRNFTGAALSVDETFNGTDIVVVGNAALNFAVSFERTLSDGAVLSFSAVQDALPAVLEDNEGNRWDIFGRAVSGPRGGSQLTPTVSYNAYWFAWVAFFPGAEIHQ